MCDPMTTIRFEALDVSDSETVRPVIDAAFAAADTACCAKRQAAVSRAVFDTARAHGFRVAWGDFLNPDAPAFIVWPADTHKGHTIREHLAAVRANEIRAHDLPGVAA